MRDYISRDTIKITKRHVRLMKTQISSGIRLVGPDSLLGTYRVSKDINYLYAGSKDSDQTG